MAKKGFLNIIEGIITSARDNGKGEAITDINHADSDLRENPYGTKIGQEVVSLEESFWARKQRYGRNAFKTWDDEALAAGAFTQKQLDVKLGTVFIPRVATFTSDVDCMFRIIYKIMSNQDTYQTGLSSEYLVNVYLKAYTPFVYKFDGELQLEHYGGFVGFQSKPSVAGKFWGCISGIEVAKNA